MYALFNFDQTSTLYLRSYAYVKKPLENYEIIESISYYEYLQIMSGKITCMLCFNINMHLSISGKKSSLG